jgi:molecular chaperone GrpE
MGRRKVPINIKSSSVSHQASTTDQAPVAEAVPPVTDREMVTSPDATGARAQEQPVQESAQEWRDRALRLQAEMENFRKRQRRLADEQILADRERLLTQILSVADDLERALEAGQANAQSLRQGVALTHQSLLRVLRQEGVEPIQAQGQTFDPAWHEALGTIPHENVGAEPGKVVRVIRQGYRMGERLLRPSRVIIAS